MSALVIDAKDVVLNGRSTGRLLALVGGREVHAATIDFEDLAAIDGFIVDTERAVGRPGVAELVRPTVYGFTTAPADSVHKLPKRFDLADDEPFVELDPEYRDEPTVDAAPADGEPVPLDVPPPPELPAGVFRGWVADMVEAVKEELEVPRELPAVFALTVLAAAVQGKVTVRPEPGYFESLAFWGACGMDPGNRKTGAYLRMTAPVRAWQARQKAIAEPAIVKAKTEEAVTRGRIKALMAKAEKADDDSEVEQLKQQIHELEASIKPVPAVPRLVIEDATPEHVATMLQQQGERLAILSDEGGLLDNWAGRYSVDGRTANLDVFLKAHSGSPVTVDRGSRPSITLNHPLLSVGLAPQPSVIATIVTNPAFRNRGITARFCLFVPRSAVGYRTLAARPVPDEVVREYDRGLTSLIELGSPDPFADAGPAERKRITLGLSPDSWRLWKDYAHEVERAMQPDGHLHDHRGWGSKLPGTVARVAALLHCADFPAAPDAQADVDAGAMHRAILFGRTAAAHYLAAFATLDDKGDLETARRLWRKLEQDRDQHGDGVVTARDLWHPHRGTFRRVQDIEGGLRLLIDHHHLIELPAPDQGKPGRPSRKFRINGRILARWSGGADGHFGH